VLRAVFGSQFSWLITFQVGVSQTRWNNREIRTDHVIPLRRDKHVGLKVCMPAYERMPLHMRQRLDGFTNGAGHLVGGSADTVYLPSHLRADFLDVLGTFLQTDCFLEIVCHSLSFSYFPLLMTMIYLDSGAANGTPSNPPCRRRDGVRGSLVGSTSFIPDEHVIRPAEVGGGIRGRFLTFISLVNQSPLLPTRCFV
jgi:hypothetical protein